MKKILEVKSDKEKKKKKKLHIEELHDMFC
jgi:hypothetical protein